MKMLYSQTLLLSLLCVNIACAMDQEPQEQAYFSKFEVQIPLRPGANAPCVQKDVYMQVPNNLVRARQNAHNQNLIPADIASSVANTLIAVYEQEAAKEMSEALVTCAQLMFDNDQGWFFPQNEVALQRVNPELLALITMKQTYFMYAKEAKRLILRWDLGEHNDGWAFDKVIAIELDSHHPRKGICSMLTVQYHNERKNIHGKVRLKTLRELYERAGKETKIHDRNIVELHKKLSKEKIDAMQAADGVAMALHYVHDPENLKDAMALPETETQDASELKK